MSIIKYKAKNKVKPHSYKDKVIISGDIIEIYKYTLPQLRGYEDKINRSGRRKDYVSENYEDNRIRTLNNARTNLKRIINSNVNQYGKCVTPKFLTLTFKDNLQDLKVANNEFKKFMQRLNYYIYGEKVSKLKYSAVVEFQERGAIHYHVVMYNMKYVPAGNINKIWDYSDYIGNINIKKIKNVDNIGNYLCKYMTKESENKTLRGNKSYFNSRGLKKPQEITDKKRVEALLQALPLKHLKHFFTFDNEYTGHTQYFQFNTKYNNDAICSHRWTLANTTIDWASYTN